MSFLKAFNPANENTLTPFHSGRDRLAATLDFTEPWTEHFRAPLRTLMEPEGKAAAWPGKYARSILPPAHSL